MHELKIYIFPPFHVTILGLRHFVFFFIFMLFCILKPNYQSQLVEYYYLWKKSSVGAATRSQNNKKLKGKGKKTKDEEEDDNEADEDAKVLPTSLA